MKHRRALQRERVPEPFDIEDPDYHDFLDMNDCLNHEMWDQASKEKNHHSVIMNKIPNMFLFEEKERMALIQLLHNAAEVQFQFKRLSILFFFQILKAIPDRVFSPAHTDRKFNSINKQDFSNFFYLFIVQLLKNFKVEDINEKKNTKTELYVYF